MRDWLSEYNPNGGTIWGIGKNGIVTMLRRLERKSGIKCNAHTFRRGFASILRRKGVDSLDIMKLGHWKSLGMVKRYSESVDFEDSQKHYKAPMERLADATGGLPKNDVVPRTRIELVTRGFSVHQQYLLIEILTNLAAVGQAAQQLLLSFELGRQRSGDGHEYEVVTLIKEFLRPQTTL